MRLWVIVCAVLLLGACTASIPLGGRCGADVAAAWEDLEATTDPARRAREVEDFRRECGVPLDLWAGPQSRGLKEIEHPCAGVVVDFVKSVPSPSDSRTTPELVFELGLEGEVVETWWAPVDSVLVGVKGDEILIPLDLGTFGTKGTDRSTALAIRPGGAFRVIALTEQTPRTLIECPSREQLPNPNVGCWNIEDRASGEMRRFAYEDPCS
jgi:hypothetical protein